MWPQLMSVMMGVFLGLWLMADDNMDTLKGKRVIVTGASGGIGEQLAYVYAEHGAGVVVTARREAELNKVAEKCRRLSPSNVSHLAVPADMKDAVSIQNLIQKAVDHMGGVDILVLNHITQSEIATFTGTPDNVHNVFNTMDINFKSYVQTAALALPHLTASNGGLVVVNSMMGSRESGTAGIVESWDRGVVEDCGIASEIRTVEQSRSVRSPKLAGYVASKFALNGFFGSLRSQFVMEQRNVAVTMCVLGFIDTPTAMEGLQQSESTRILRLVRPVSASGTARAIAGASARRDDVMYHPSWTNQMFLWLNSLWPSAGDFIMRELARY